MQYPFFRTGFLFVTVLFCAWVSTAYAQEIETGEPVEPGVYIYDLAHMRKVKAAMSEAENPYASALAQLRKEANEALKAGPFSVTHKKAVAPSGDKHDYLSYATYWWPNPDTADGLPYVQRDGQFNPDRLDPALADLSRKREMTEAVKTLSLGYFFFEDERYAGRAALLLRTWFIHPRTRMNPHITYAQIVPGRPLRRYAIMDAREFMELIDPIALLHRSTAWTKKDQEAVQQWYADFLQWLLTSDAGKKQKMAKNNHGTFYDMMVVNCALFTGNRTLARQVLEEVKTNRIARHIEPDGQQPEEIKRADGWQYSIFHLIGYMRMALMGEHVGVDLWNYATEDGRGLRKAFEYLAPYVVDKEAWPHSRTDFAEKTYPHRIEFFFTLAAAKYRDKDFSRLLENMQPVDPTHRSHLTRWCKVE